LRCVVTRSGVVGRRTLLKSVLYLTSVGLALHLILPQLPGIERSLVLISDSSVPLIAAAFFTILASQMCYAELLGRSTAAAAGIVPASKRRRMGLGRWFMLRLTLAEHGAARVLPGGGSSAAAVTYTGLRSRGLRPARIGLAVATIMLLVYGTLGAIFLGSLLYLTLDNALGRATTTAAFVVFVLTLCLVLLGYFAYLRPLAAKRLMAGFFYALGRTFRRKSWSRKRTEMWAARIVVNVKLEVRALREQLLGHPLAAIRLGALALGYWGFDALCLLVIFLAFGVQVDPVHLLVAFGVATTFGSLPLTPGGLGVFEATMLGTLTLLGVGYEAAIPVLGYRLFNFWLPIPLALILYPTLHLGASKYAREEDPEPIHARKKRR
jgi:glycosyltransferase 2 family protein